MEKLLERKRRFADSVISELDIYARKVDDWVYGLPRHSLSYLEGMKVIVIGKLDDYESEKDKVCLLINAPNSWILDVDGKRISFYGSENAEYFADMYGSLGYQVVREVIES